MITLTNDKPMVRLRELVNHMARRVAHLDSLPFVELQEAIEVIEAVLDKAQRDQADYQCSECGCTLGKQ